MNTSSTYKIEVAPKANMPSNRELAQAAALFHSIKAQIVAQCQVMR